ncbi:asparaginase [Bordetella bronchialis]|uniref:L-asparaginase n=1 Tax=Bordetella bronchialis TaxID=463025 RepID=A0ABN4QYC6_9BORD|nr:asparaginase [Bordetella bronchialis]ANN64945.1 L-asparaginase [Bordetella bronchialis]
MAGNTSLPRVAIIGCGGTITSRGTGPLDTMDYPEFGTKLSVAEVLEAIPEAANVARAVLVPFREVSSSAITMADWFALRATIRRMAAEEPDLAGFVILHGTATLEETAFFLDLTLSLAQPVVLVGAQRPLSAVGSDAPMNVIAALRTAAAPQSRGRGVLVVLNDEISSARDVVKTHTLRVQTFRSADFGPLGVVDPDGVFYYRRNEPRMPAEATAPDFTTLPDDAVLPRVDIIYSHVGADGMLVDACVAAGARGIVSAGLAPGMPAKAEREAYENARRAGVALVQCTRAGSGRVANRRALRENGWIAGNSLSPQKARILLALALSQTQELETLRLVFAGH